MSNGAAQAVRDWLRENGKTHQWLANRLGVQRQQVTQWLTGHRVPMKHAGAIEDLTGVPVRAWRDSE